ncbi:hypothetical protein [Natrinema sp. 1APR25-10V2]|uniref:hypothetical protein n=1 Tax=Natrinema sp. 1APR25-10V2 TaxID=2951081 RepID=UPI002876884C|nr:hypothetical protein [Natrinema sp. 1APR25-10V2]MDS0474118.1 hypothetical protein [Natrinema sp. 1APR25-10V2]
MYEASREILCVIIGIPTLTVVAYILFVFLAFTPIGWLALGILVLVALAVSSWDSEPPIRINCSECGSPSETDSVRCKHCDTALETADDT